MSVVSESFLVHSDMEITYVDPTFCTFVGADSQERLIGVTLTDIVLPDYHAALSEQVERIENKDVPTLGLSVTFQTFTDHHQRAIVVSSLIEWDGIEQVQTAVFPVRNADSEGYQQLHNQAMDEAPVGITIADPSKPDSPLIYVNDGFCELTGYPRGESIGQNCRFLQGESTREEPVAKMRTAIEAKEPVTVTLRNYRKDGSMFWNRVTIVPIRSDSRTVTNWLGYQEDITAEKRYEQDLSLFKAQAEGTDKAVVITDPEGTIEYVNSAFEQMTGYTATEATGVTPRIIKSDQQDQEFYTALWDRITAGEVWEAELTNQTKHGELFEVKQKIIPVTGQDSDITHFVGIEQDVTEKLLTTQTLGVLNRVLRHNLRNSLNVIDGHAELLETEDLDPEARHASLAAIRDQTASMKKISEKTAEIRAIWDLTENHRSWDRFDIQTLVEAYQQQYPNAKITSTTGNVGEIQVRNTELFKKAIDEAVENAVKHADQVPPEVTITVENEPDAERVRVTVADNGPGIPELERQIIESGEETQLSHSLGIGLWVMEWITKTLGGELTITDNEPRGSVVTFQLPAGRSKGK